MQCNAPRYHPGWKVVVSSHYSRGPPLCSNLPTNKKRRERLIILKLHSEWKDWLFFSCKKIVLRKINNILFAPRHRLCASNKNNIYWKRFKFFLSDLFMWKKKLLRKINILLLRSTSSIIFKNIFYKIKIYLYYPENKTPRTSSK